MVQKVQKVMNGYFKYFYQKIMNILKFYKDRIVMFGESNLMLRLKLLCNSCFVIIIARTIFSWEATKRAKREPGYNIYCWMTNDKSYYRVVGERFYCVRADVIINCIARSLGNIHYIGLKLGKLQSNKFSLCQFSRSHLLCCLEGC